MPELLSWRVDRSVFCRFQKMNEAGIFFCFLDRSTCFHALCSRVTILACWLFHQERSSSFFFLCIRYCYFFDSHTPQQCERGRPYTFKIVKAVVAFLSAEISERARGHSRMHESPPFPPTFSSSHSPRPSPLLPTAPCPSPPTAREFQSSRPPSQTTFHITTSLLYL